MEWEEESEVGSFKAITLVAAVDKGLFLEAINCQQMSSLVISQAKRKKGKKIRFVLFVLHIYEQSQC